jgi:S1-C subfamily serine protease
MQPRMAVGLISAIVAGAMGMVVPRQAPAQNPASMSCEELWYARNAIYARNGYCFNSERGRVAFGTGCFPPYGRVSGLDGNRITQLQIWERQKGCSLEGHGAPATAPAASAPNPLPNIQAERQVFGTAFYITGEGHLLTNAHVVKECKSITVSHVAEDPIAARPLALDVTNDLAIISTGSKPEAVASFRPAVRLGEAVAAYGFPLTGLLSSSGNFTVGNVTALSGLKDDSRVLQISAPVQVGNSGGPLLDETGAVVGIVVSKLNAIAVATATDDLAQNINFAIKASTARAFAEAQGINLEAAAPGGAILRPADLADKARSISAHLTCTRWD